MATGLSSVGMGHAGDTHLIRSRAAFCAAVRASAESARRLSAARCFFTGPSSSKSLSDHARRSSTQPSRRRRQGFSPVAQHDPIDEKGLEHVTDVDDRLEQHGGFPQSDPNDIVTVGVACFTGSFRLNPFGKSLWVGRDEQPTAARSLWLEQFGDRLRPGSRSGRRRLVPQ